MKFFLNSRNAIARALCAGFVVWCVSTGEGFSAQPSSFNGAKSLARYIMSEVGREGWYING